MIEDIRAALETAVDDAPHPGPGRLARWQDSVPRMVAAVREPAPPPWAVAPVAVLWNRHVGERRPGGRLVAAVLVMGVMLGLTLPWAGRQIRRVGGSPTGITATRPGPPRAPVITLVSDASCPVDEVRFHELDGAYSLCRPAAWVARNYSNVDGLQDAVSVVGFGPSGSTPTAAQAASTGPSAEVVVSVTFESMAAVEQREGLVDPTPIVVAGQPADLFNVSQGDGLGLRTMVVLLERGDRLYELELSPWSAAGEVSFNHILRTFSFQGLPYYADPEFKVERNTA
jgi:hypothetical protein